MSGGFQDCFDSWDVYEGLYYRTFAGGFLPGLTKEAFEGIYGSSYITNNGTTLTNPQLNSRVVTDEHAVARTRTRAVTVYTGELRSLVNLIRYMRAGYPLAVSYYVIFCYSMVDCWSSSVFSIESLPERGTFALSDILNKMDRYSTIVPTLCEDRSITVILRELL